MSEAKRNDIPLRFDLLDPEFLIGLAKTAHVGNQKYDTHLADVKPKNITIDQVNWKQSELKGADSPINHALKHIELYRAGIPDDEDNQMSTHLVHAAFNLMMEYWYLRMRQTGSGSNDARYHQYFMDMLNRLQAVKDALNEPNVTATCNRLIDRLSDDRWVKDNYDVIMRIDPNSRVSFNNYIGLLK